MSKFKVMEVMMRYLILLLLVGALVYGCGCSNITSPAFGAGGNQDKFPIFYGTDAGGGADNGYMVFCNTATPAWKVPRLIANDLLDGQMSEQRSCIGNDGKGTWNETHIDSGNDLNIYESPDDHWLDDAGAWTLVDDDAGADYTSCDVETRQNYMWIKSTITGPFGFINYIDLSIGIPAITPGPYVNVLPFDNEHYSIVLDNYNWGVIHYVYQSAGGNYMYDVTGPVSAFAIYTGFAFTGDYPQILNVSNGAQLYISSTAGNILYGFHSDTTYPQSQDSEIIYIATALTSAYHATWRYVDDTIHVALVDYNNAAPDSTYLIYLRRTSNGWSAPITLLAVDSRMMFDNDNLIWPNITTDVFGNILISYIFESTTGAGGDLEAYYLPASLYDDFDNLANWTSFTDIDAGVTPVIWAIMEDYCPI